MTLGEVIVIFLILSLFVLTTLLILPRQREVARLSGCRRNLMQVGAALSLYGRTAGGVPYVASLGEGPPGISPLKSLLETLVIPDLNGLTRDGALPKPVPGSAPGERPVPGFVCPSDPNATSGLHPAPISYRAATGDAPEGLNGGFAPGRTLKLSEIEAGDGLNFTSAFSERMVGTAKDETISPFNYAVVSPPLSEGGCGPQTARQFRGDAGSSWAHANWRSTLYNHAMPPNSSSSCIATDSRSALMGASSGHIPGVNVLVFDGSVRTVTSTIAPQLWRSLATTHGEPRSEDLAPLMPSRPDGRAPTR